MPDWGSLSKPALVAKCLEFEKSMDHLIERHNVAITEQHRLIKQRAEVINSAVELTYQSVLDQIAERGWRYSVLATEVPESLVVWLTEKAREKKPDEENTT